jgi:DNA-binding GntR family transcriptional regulator
MDPPDHGQAQPLQLSDLDRIRNLLKEQPRDLLLLELAVQTKLPIQWLLNLKTLDLADIKPNDRKVIENDHGRTVGTLTLSESLHRTWRDYLKRVAPSENDYIFKSKKGVGPLKLSSVSNLVNEWFEALGLTGPRGLRSLRATHKLHFEGSQPDISTGDEAPDHLSGLKPVEFIPAHEFVYRGLFDAIISGAIPPGQRLVPESIAAQMNVSRMPVREALQRLRAAGFVSIKAKGRIVANRLSRSDLEEIQHIRLLLEREAAGRAATRREETAITRLESIHKVHNRSINSGKIEQIVKSNKQFHMTIYSQSGMPVLAQMIETLLDRVSPYLHIELKEVDPAGRYLQNSVSHHQEILNGMRERDPNKVVHFLTIDHNKTTKQILKIFKRKE